MSASDLMRKLGHDASLYTNDQLRQLLWELLGEFKPEKQRSLLLRFLQMTFQGRSHADH